MCGQIIIRECQKVYFREESAHSCGIFSRGPRLETKTPIPPLALLNLHGWSSGLFKRAAWSIDTRWRRGDCLGSWTECPVISAVLLHHKSSFSIGPLGKRPWVLRRPENSKDTLILEPQPQGLGTDCRCLGGTVSAQCRGKWLSLRVWGLRCAENFPSLTRWLSVFLSAFHPQLSKEGRGVQGPSWDLVYTTVALSSCWQCGCSWDWDCPPPGFSGFEDSAPLSLLHAALFRRTKSETTQSFQFSSA